MARISELHYSNAYAASSGINEFLEVSLSPSEDPADFTVGFYNADGTQYIAIDLDDPGVVMTYDPETNENVYVISADVFGILLTDPDGGGAGNTEAYALVDTTTSTVIDFYDIGGGTQNILATDGVAAGATSDNLAVLVGPNSTTTTLQFNQPDPNTVTYENVNPGDTGEVPCFVEGTLIETADGPVAVEDLVVGQMVNTLDNGDQPLRWVGATTVQGRGKCTPVRIKAGTLGAKQDLLVSPQHRIFIEGWQAEMLYGQDSVLVAAKHLINDHSICWQPCDTVRYFHILFDQHEVVTSGGVLSESFHPTDFATTGAAAETRKELVMLFPEMDKPGYTFGQSARQSLKSHEGRLLHGLI